MAQLMPLPLTVSCFSKIQTAFTFLVPAHPGSPGKRAVKRVCVCVLFKFSLLLSISVLSSARRMVMFLTCLCVHACVHACWHRLSKSLVVLEFTS